MTRRGLLAGLACVMAPRLAYGQFAVICPTCTQWYDQIASYVIQVKQWASDVARLQTQMSMYANMVTQGMALPSAVFSTVVADMNTVRGIANQASMLFSGAAPIMQRLQTANAYASQAVAFPANVGSQFDSWSSTIGNASSQLAKVLGIQQGQQLGYAALQAAAQTQSSTAAGQMQAIQAGNELAGLISTQLNQVQTTLTAWAQADTTRHLVDDDKEARKNGAEQLMTIGAHQVPLAGYKDF